MAKNIVILGSTGSIGQQTLAVIRRLAPQLQVVGLSGHSNIQCLQKQIQEFRPEIVSVWEDTTAHDLQLWCKKKGLKTSVLSGLEGLREIASYAKADLVLSAVVGSIGLEPLMAAITSKKRIALANKEALVIAGDVIMAATKKYKTTLIPVDSEHSAIFQCLKDERSADVQRILLTASGGPFYRSTKDHARITVPEALDHPTWKMGRKITIDSATLMNKGLEAIEAHHLFGVPLENVGIVIHPQSIIHSMVEFIDTTVLAHMSYPNMELPIQYALTYPARVRMPIKPLDLAHVKKLEFDSPDFKKFPCLRLALEAGKLRGTMPAVMNAANEIAVYSFLQYKIKFSKIATIIEKTMGKHRNKNNPSLQDILHADAWARQTAQGIV